MKVLHVTPSFYPAGRFGGPTYSGYGLCNALAKLPAVEVRVLTTNSNGPETLRTESVPVNAPQNYTVYYCRRATADLAPGMFWRLPQLIRWADVVHLTAVYSPPTIPTLLLSRLFGKPVMWSPRGALQRWEGTTRTRAKLVWDKICDRLSSPRQVMLHVTSEQEKVESLARLKRVSAAIIPNVVDAAGSNGHERGSGNGSLRLLYLGRLHPIKGIENLLQALTRLNDKVTLSVCGEGKADYQGRLKAMAAALGIAERVHFHGRVDGGEKEQQFRNADLCVVPSFKESFCMVAAESLAHGLPVIASRGTPWQALTANDCGWWIDNDPETLAHTIALARTMPLREMGERGRQWIARDFSWPKIAADMLRCYQTLIETNRARGIE